MKRITDVRNGLYRIPNAIAPFPPGGGYRGNEPGLEVTTLHLGDDPNAIGRDGVLGSFGVEQADGIGDGDAVDDFEPLFEVGSEVDEGRPLLDGSEGEAIRQSVLQHGIDALGWYVPFHHPGPQWGIYVPISGLAYLAADVFGKLPARLDTRLGLAFHAILNHELFHFATEYTVAQAELVHQEPWYVPAKKDIRTKTPNYFAVEEQLANAYMLKAFRSARPNLRVKGKQAALEAFTREQPVGYREGHLVGLMDWAEMLGNLAECYGLHGPGARANARLWGFKSGYDWAAQFPIRPRIDWRWCPIHIVHDGARLGLPAGWLGFFSRLDRITETEGFVKRLGKLAPPVQAAWDRTKQRLSTCITAGADFKRWPSAGPDCYSVRVNDNVRAHLQRRPAPDDWLAVAIGGHKEMGHG